MTEKVSEPIPSQNTLVIYSSHLSSATTGSSHGVSHDSAPLARILGLNIEIDDTPLSLLPQILAEANHAKLPTT